MTTTVESPQATISPAAAELLPRVCVIAARQSNVDAATVSADTHLCNDLHFDSLDQVEFVMSIEEEFSVIIPEERAQGVRTVGQVAELIVALRA